jgi:hypothetical protein
MDLAHFSKFELFKNNEEFQASLKKLAEIKNFLQTIVAETQKTCLHKECTDVRKIRAREESVGILDERICIDCGDIQKRPIGNRYVVCDYCWGQMEDLGHRPIGEDRTHFYKCTVCKHQVSHT